MLGRPRRWRSRRPPRDEATILKSRFIIYRVVVLFLFCILAARLWQMQIIDGQRYRLRAETNRLRIASSSPLRGVIYDRNGTLLAHNVPSFAIGVIPADLPLREQATVAQRLGSLVGMASAEIESLVNVQRANQRQFESVVIRTDIPQELAFIVDEHHTDLPGVVLLTEPKRHYIHGEAAAHVLGSMGRLTDQEFASLQSEGYLADDKLGKAGIELQYERQLRGSTGQEVVEIDVYGRKVRTLDVEPAKPGYNLVLNLDIELQQAMAAYLAEGMGKARYAAAIAMNPQTGEILGLVSLPSFDPNIFSTPLRQAEAAAVLRDQRQPLFNQATSGVHPPGSTVKPVIAAAALQEGVATPQTRIVSTGAIAIASEYNPNAVTIMRDWAALGSLDLYQAIAQSSDVYFYHLAGGYQEFRGLGIDRLASYLKAFGFGQRTGIDLPGESAGLAPDPQWKEAEYGEPWYLGDTYNLGIGQGYMTATPLQLLVATAAIANGGTLYQPQALRQIVDNEGHIIETFTPKPLRQTPVSPQYLDVVREGMRQAVAWGAASNARVPGVEVAGKTGTAEFGGIEPATGERASHGWFTAFAPFDSPQIALVVFQQRGGGAQTAAPVAGKILRFYFEREAKRQGKELPPAVVEADRGT